MSKEIKYKDAVPNSIVTRYREELLAQPEQWQPECCICKTNENVEWVGGYQAYRCNSKDCIPL